MALKRRIKKLKNSQVLKITGRKFLTCKECDIKIVEVPADIKFVTCAYCVQKMVSPPENIKPKSPEEKFPRGWALKVRYVHVDGRVFEKGKETGEVVTPESSKPKKSKTKKVTKKKTPKWRKINA